MALYTDDFLAGFSLPDSAVFEEWQLFERESLRRQFGNALAALVAWRVEQGEPQQAVELARRWVALDPLHEVAQRALMRAYALSAQHTAALRQYELAAQLVDTELGASLEGETTALYSAIRSRRLPPVAGRESHDAGDQTVAPKTDDAAPTDRTQHPVV